MYTSHHTDSECVIYLQNLIKSKSVYRDDDWINRYWDSWFVNSDDTDTEEDENDDDEEYREYKKSDEYREYKEIERESKESREKHYRYRALEKSLSKAISDYNNHSRIHLVFEFEVFRSDIANYIKIVSSDDYESYDDIYYGTSSTKIPNDYIACFMINYIYYSIELPEIFCLLRKLRRFFNKKIHKDISGTICRKILDVIVEEKYEKRLKKYNKIVVDSYGSDKTKNMLDFLGFKESFRFNNFFIGENWY